MNKYEIVGIVGEGAYGIVYKAKNKETGEFGKTTHISIDLFKVYLTNLNTKNSQDSITLTYISCN